MSRYAAAPHRRLDQAFADALARDDGDASGGHAVPLLSPSRRLKDLRTMQSNRVRLTTLSVKTSGKGRTYLSGWLGKASVVGFEGEADKFGNPTWELFVSEPTPRPGQGVPAREGVAGGRDAPGAAGARHGGAERRHAGAQRGDDMALDDQMPF